MIENTAGFFRRLIRWRFGRLLVVLAGIFFGQIILYGPSLIGKKILLPLDILAQPDTYLPRTPEFQGIGLHDFTLADRIYVFEPSRQFAVSEIRAGRWPLWNPNQYTGAPFIWQEYSPIRFLGWCVKSPVILAWIQLLNAIVAGLGAYVFFRRVLKVGFLAAAIPAWCYPLTGFFIFWEGHRVAEAVYWFPWLLFAVDQAVRKTGAWTMAGLSVATYLTLVSGSIDVAGQALLISGFFAIWSLWDAHRGRWFSSAAINGAMILAFGWLLGFCLAAPCLLPQIEYARTGIRLQLRTAGLEERPPVGLSALPQTVLPDIYGATRTGSLYLASGNQTESAAAAYAGVIATLFLAPLAWCSRRHRSSNLFWLLIGFFGLSWCLNLPGIVTLLRLPGLNMMSHNRLVFATAFAVLTLAAVGLEVLARGGFRRRRWFLLPVVLLAGLFGWCVYRSIFLPEPMAAQIAAVVNQGGQFKWIRDLADLQRVQAWFAQSAAVAAILCGIGILGWRVVWQRPMWRAEMVAVLGIFLVADLLWFARDRSAQCDPALYYPRIPVLEAIAHAGPGRIIGNGCLPPMLADTQGLSDVRGFDGIDPANLVQVMALAAATNTLNISYADIQWFVPRSMLVPPDGIRLSPILDMLNVRYVVFRGTPPPEIHPAFQSPDYWALENKSVLPRAFVPAHIETVADARARLQKLASSQFNPREVAYVETPVELPAVCRGLAEIISETPTRVTLSVKMETAGMVVLADLWDKGWRGYLNGKPAPVLRVNHAIRGVMVPAGNATLEFRYEPSSLAWGLRLTMLAAAVLSAALLISAWRQRQKNTENLKTRIMF